MQHCNNATMQHFTLLPTRYVSDSYTILVAVFALLRLPLSGIHHQMHVHRHAHFEFQSQRRLGIVARRLGEKRVDAIREQEALAGEYGRLSLLVGVLPVNDRKNLFDNC